MNEPASIPADCEHLLCQMVGFDTVNGRQSGRPEAELPLAEHLESIAGRWGFATRRLPVEGFAPDLLITHEVDPAAPWLLFDSHLDTVSVAGMTIDPFEADRSGGRIWGRGACDTKGTGAAMLWALRDYAAAPGGSMNVAVLFTVDEEVGQAGAQAFTRRHLDGLGWRPVGVVVGEPTRMRPISATNGVVRWRISAAGTAAHSSTPHLGRSAISDMLRVVEAVESRYIASVDARHPLTGKAACSINIIRGGGQINIIPDTCTIDVDRRVVPGEDTRAVIPAVEKILDDLRREVPGLDVTQGEPDVWAPLDPALGESFCSAVGAILAREGFDPEPAGAAYATNGSSFSEAGLPCVVLGPGDIAQAHTKDEWISVEQLRLGVKAYRALMDAPAETWT